MSLDIFSFILVFDEINIFSEDIKFYDNLNRELDDVRVIKCIENFQSCACFFIKIINPVVNVQEKTKFSIEVKDLFSSINKHL